VLSFAGDLDQSVCAFNSREQVLESIRKVLRWSPKTGQVAKRESPFGTAGLPEVRHGEYTEEA